MLVFIISSLVGHSLAGLLLYARRGHRLVYRVVLPLSYASVVAVIASTVVPLSPSVQLTILGLTALVFSLAGTALFNQYYAIIQGLFLVFWGVNTLLINHLHYLFPSSVLGIGLYIGILIAIATAEFYGFTASLYYLSHRLITRTSN